MTSDLSEQLTSQSSAFWSYCARLLAIYPQRPAAMSRDAEAKQLERQLISLGNQLAPTLCPSDHWQVAASVGKGNWASVPWVAFFDTRQTRSAQKEVYPVIHFSPDSPVGIRIGLGIAAKAYRGREDEKAVAYWRRMAAVSKQLGSDSHQQLSDAGFINASGNGPLVILGSVSGAVKSTLSALIAELTIGKTHYVSVLPDWTNSSSGTTYLRFEQGIPYLRNLA